MLTAERLRELLHYDPATGLFTWRVAKSNRAPVGGVAGSLAVRGCVDIGVDGVRHKAHRLAWLYMTGRWPDAEIDHRNTVPHDNRWSNLRELPHVLNSQNSRAPRSNNTTGFLGVTRNGGRFRAQITVNGKAFNLGRYETPERAYEVYVAAKRRLHESCTL